MRRDWDLAEVWDFFGHGLGWESQVGGNHLTAFFLGLGHGLLHDDLVHGSVEIELHFEEDAVGVDAGLASEGAGGGGHPENAGALLVVKLSKLLARHVVDEEVVADLRIGVDALAVSLSDSLGEDAWVLGVEEQVDPGELDVLLLTFDLRVPVAGVDLALLIIAVDEDCAPVANSFRVLVETLSWNWEE